MYSVIEQLVIRSVISGKLISESREYTKGEEEKCYISWGCFKGRLAVVIKL